MCIENYLLFNYLFSLNTNLSIINICVCTRNFYVWFRSFLMYWLHNTNLNRSNLEYLLSTINLSIVFMNEKNKNIKYAIFQMLSTFVKVNHIHSSHRMAVVNYTNFIICQIVYLYFIWMSYIFGNIIENWNFINTY